MWRPGDEQRQLAHGVGYSSAGLAAPLLGGDAALAQRPPCHAASPLRSFSLSPCRDTGVAYTPPAPVRPESDDETLARGPGPMDTSRKAASAPRPFRALRSPRNKAIRCSRSPRPSGGQGHGGAGDTSTRDSSMAANRSRSRGDSLGEAAAAVDDDEGFSEQAKQIGIQKQLTEKVLGRWLDQEPRSGAMLQTRVTVTWQNSLRSDDESLTAHAVDEAAAAAAAGVLARHMPQTPPTPRVDKARAGSVCGPPARSPTLCSSAHSSILRSLTSPDHQPLADLTDHKQQQQQQVAEDVRLALPPPTLPARTSPGGLRDAVAGGIGRASLEDLVGELQLLTRLLLQEAADMQVCSGRVWRENKILRHNLEEARIIKSNLTGAAGAEQERDALARQVEELTAALEEERQQHQQERLLWMLHRSPEACHDTDKDKASQSSSYSLSCSTSVSSTPVRPRLEAGGGAGRSTPAEGGKKEERNGGGARKALVDELDLGAGGREGRLPALFSLSSWLPNQECSQQGQQHQHAAVGARDGAAVTAPAAPAAHTPLPPSLFAPLPPSVAATLPPSFRPKGAESPRLELAADIASHLAASSGEALALHAPPNFDDAGGAGEARWRSSPAGQSQAAQGPAADLTPGDQPLPANTSARAAAGAAAGEGGGGGTESKQEGRTMTPHYMSPRRQSPCGGAQGQDFSWKTSLRAAKCGSRGKAGKLSPKRHPQRATAPPTHLAEATTPTPVRKTSA